MKGFITAALFFIFLGTAFGQSQSPDLELQKIKDHCRQLLLSDTAYATEQSYRFTDDIIYKTDATGYFKTLTAEGNWRDIDYQSKLRSGWQPSWHLFRVMLLYRAYYKNKNPEYLSAVHKAMHYWIKNDFLSENWWPNNINIPFAFSSLVLMLKDDVLPEEMDFLNNVMIKRIPVYKATGQNLIWQLDNEARIALIKNNASSFASIMTRMQSVIDVTTKEGVQPDFSFQQHGPMLQFGNYGMHFTNSLLFWMKITANTFTAFDEKKQEVIFDYVSNGLRWSIYKGAMDITAVGRQIRENSGLKRGDNLEVNANMLKSFDRNYKCKYIVDGFDHPKEAACELAGNKSFWRSDYMVHLLKDQYMMSVKMHGPFVSRVEAINGENLKGPFLNDGVTLIQRTGKEYRNIEALWNWIMLPGTTTDTTVSVTSKQATSTFNQGNFTGQVSDGKQGISVMDYNRIDIKAHKSYFFTDGMMIAMGAGITSSDLKNVVTTVDQKFYDKKKPLSSGKNGKGESWLWLDSIAYFSLNNTPFSTKIETKNSNWGSIDLASGDKPVTGTLITAFIAHLNNDKYAYIVKPGTSLKETKKISENKAIKVLSNSSSIQAIETDKTMMAVFYLAGKLSFFNKSSITVDQSCLIISQKSGEMWISDPTRKLKDVNIVINGRSKRIEFPTGDYVGSAMEVK